MNKLCSVLLVLLSLAGCEFSGKEAIKIASPEYPKMHYASTDHNVGAPSSLIYRDGVYSLFYQSFNIDQKIINPYYRITSKDLIHWRKAEKVNFGIDGLNVLYCNVVADEKHSSRLGTKTSTPFVAFLLCSTGKDGQTSFKLSVSNDQGITWTASNEKVSFPELITADFKPALIWDEHSGKWIMSLVNDQKVKFYSSLDLQDWKFESEFEKEAQFRNNIWAKATLFPLKKDEGWALLVDQEFADPKDGSTIQYFIGTFDGHFFNNQSKKPHWLDYGKDNIYNVVCSGVSRDQDPVLIGLKNNIDYTLMGSMKPFWGSFTFPRTVAVEEVYGEKLLASEPLKALKAIVKPGSILRNLNVEEKLDVSDKISVAKIPSVITLKFETSEMTRMTFPSKFGVRLSNEMGESIVVGFDRFRDWYYIDRKGFEIVTQNTQFGGIQVMPCYHADSVMVFKMIVDDSSIELFTEDGKLVMTSNFTPQKKLNKISLFGENGIIKVLELDVKNVDSIWQN